MATYESVMRYSGDKGQVFPFEEISGSANDWYENDLVMVDATTGQLTIATAGDAILGIAQERATGVAAHKIEVELINPNTIYTIRDDASVTPDITKVGDIWDIVFTKSAHVLNVTAGTDGQIYIVGLYPETAAAGTRLLIRFSATKCFDVASA